MPRIVKSVSFVALLALLSSAILTGAGLLSATTARAESRATLLSVDAGLLFAQALRVKDAEKRAELLDEAQALLDRIVAEHPDSKEAVMLRADEKLAGLSPSILAAAREAVRREMEAGGLISSSDRQRCLSRPTMSCLYDLAAITARQLDSKGRRIALLAEVAEARARGGELDKALTLARPLAYGTPDGPGARALTEIAVLQLQSGQLDAALATAKALPGRATVDRARSRLVTALAQAGSLEPAQSIAGEIESKGPAIEARAALALARGGAGSSSLDQDIEAAHRLSNARESDATLEALSIALLEAGDYARSARAARQIIEPSLLRRAVSRAAERWAAAGGLAEALKLARELGRSNGGSRLVVRIAETRIEAGDFASLVAILRDEAGPEAGVQVLNRLAASEMDAAWASALAAVAVKLDQPGERARALAISARGAMAAGEVEAARTGLEAALGAAAVLDEWERAPVMLEAAAIAVYRGQAEAARAHLSRVPAGTFWADEVVGLSAALAAQALSGSPAGVVLGVIQGLADEADRQRLLLIVARAMAARGAGSQALALADSLPEGPVRDQGYFGVAKALIGAGVDPRQAAEVFERATTLRDDDQLLLEFARGQAAAGDLRGALRTGERIGSVEAKSRVFMALAERLRNPLAMQ